MSTSVTVYYDGEPNSTYYLKPRPTVASPWTGDVISGVRNEATNEITFTVQVGREYRVYRQATDVPLISDVVYAYYPEIEAPTSSAVPVVVTNPSSAAIRQELAGINEILSAGVSTVTVDGTTTTYDLDSLRARKRELQQELCRYSSAEARRRPVASSINLNMGGW